jgi:predicted kinase
MWKRKIKVECILFIGIQASGKSTFYKERFFGSHMRVNLDMLKTRHRENAYVMTSIRTRQSFVVDNTNPTKEERVKYIEAAKPAGFRIIGYYFEPDFQTSVDRNEQRMGSGRVPLVAIKSTISKLQQPEIEEGFDELYRVRSAQGEFVVERMAQD